MAIENKTKATLYHELIEQLPVEMNELLEEVKAKFRRWHFEQTWKYTSTLDATYECIQQLEEKDKEEDNIEEVASEEAIQDEAKRVYLLEEDEDEITTVKKLIRK